MFKFVFKIESLLPYTIFIFIFCVNIGGVELYSIVNSLDHYLPSILFNGLLLLSSLMALYYYRSPIILIILIFYFILILSSFWGVNPYFGIRKASIGLLLPLSLMLFMTPLRHKSKIIPLAFCHLMLFINLIALVYKLKNGLLIRQVNFGLLGPITFGWLNVFLLVFSLANNYNIKYLILAFVMIIWSGSKGPFLISIIYCIFHFKKTIFQTSIRAIFLFFICFTIAIYYLFQYYEDFRIFNTIVELSSNSEDYTSGAGAGSIGSRLKYYSLASELWLKYPFFGIGFGSWEYFVTGHKYPHNIVLELLAEVGLIGISVFLLILFKLKNNNYLFILVTGLGLQMVSGDFSYFRYYFIFILIGIVDVKK